MHSFGSLVKNVKKYMFENPTMWKSDAWTNDVESNALQLSELYSKLGIGHENGIWQTKHFSNFDLGNFRGDNIYIWQTRTYSEVNYFVAYLQALELDNLSLFDKLKESVSYGVETFNFDGRLVSRDLIDSVIEINYLNKHLNVLGSSNFNVLDIGAGYGRLAKRLIQSFSNVNVWCLDAIPLSTCISKFYLEEEIKSGKAKVLQLNETQLISKGSIKVATNIHSFSEMKLSSIEFWIKFLVEKEIEYVFIVPNGSELALNDGTDFSALFFDAKYCVVDKSSKFPKLDFSRFGIYPSTYYLLHRKF